MLKRLEREMGGRDWAGRGAERVEIIRREQSLNRLETHPSTSIHTAGLSSSPLKLTVFLFLCFNSSSRSALRVSGHSSLFINIKKKPWSTAQPQSQSDSNERHESEGGENMLISCSSDPIGLKKKAIFT